MATVKITKLVHSTIVVEGGGPTVLIDPGGYTWADDRFDVSTLPEIHRVLITHGHPDHLSVEFARELSVRFPSAAVETTPDVVDVLANHGIRSTTAPVEYVTRFEAPHELTPIGTAPANVGFHVKGAITHPGDSHTFSSTMPILAMALVPPWGSMTDAVARIRALEPKYVIPVHDWHLRPEGRDFIGTLAAASFADHDITYLPLAEFEAVTLDVD